MRTPARAIKILHVPHGLTLSFLPLPALHFFPFSARFRNCSKEPSKSVARPVLTARNSVREKRSTLHRASEQRWSHRFSFFRHPRLIFLPYAPLLFPLPRFRGEFLRDKLRNAQCTISKPTAPPSFFFEIIFRTRRFPFFLRQILVAFLFEKMKHCKFHLHLSLLSLWNWFDNFILSIMIYMEYREEKKYEFLYECDILNKFR